jgi:ParB family chromosome partitioning protein
LPDAIKDALVAGVITEGHVRPLLSLGDPKLMLDVFKTILKDNYTVRQTEELTRRIKGDIQKKEPKNEKAHLWVPEQDQMAKEIQEKYAADDVEILQSGRQVKIVIIMKGDPQITSDKLRSLHKTLIS